MVRKQWQAPTQSRSRWAWYKVKRAERSEQRRRRVKESGRMWHRRDGLEGTRSVG